jgi:DNA-binding NarL/FixJ family response regulator
MVKSADFFPCPDALLYTTAFYCSLIFIKPERRAQAEPPGAETMEGPYYILLADNHAGFRREVRKILEEIPGVKVSGEAGNRRELLELLQQSPPKLVILDISLPDLRVREGTQLIKLHYPETRVLIMVMDQGSEYLTYGLAVGAAGVLPKQHVGGQMAQAITSMRQGKIYVPPQGQGKNSPRVAAPTAAGSG